MTLSDTIGNSIGRARDAVARLLIFVGATPNRITVLGFAVTLAAAVLLAAGAGEYHGADGHPRGTHYLIAAGCLLVLAGFLDMLDGAVARIGRMSTPFGAFLDSTLDRFSDIALMLGVAAYYSRHHNVTFTLLAMIAMANALLISYARAKAESLDIPCKVGYWERGERFAALMIACFCHGMPAVLWQLALLPGLTALHRLLHTYWELSARPAEPREDDETAPAAPPIASGDSPAVYDQTARSQSRPLSPLAKLLFFDYRRGSIPYDFITAANIAFILFAPVTDNHDILGDGIRSVVGDV